MLKKTVIVALIILLLGVSGCGTLYGISVERKDRLKLSQEIVVENAIYGSEAGIVLALLFNGSTPWWTFISVLSMFYIVDEITGGMYIKKP